MIGSFNGKLRNELLDREIFFTLKEAQVLIEDWRVHYNPQRPTAHSTTGRQRPKLYSSDHSQRWPQASLNEWYKSWGQVKCGNPQRRP